MPLTWDTAADWDSATSESGVVNESVTNTDHNDAASVKRGYNIANPYLSANLAVYCPFHEDSGSTAYDFSGNNNDGTISGATVGSTGLVGTTCYGFDGTDDDVSIPDDPSWSGLDPVSVSFWFNPDLNLSGGSANNWAFAVAAGEWGFQNSGSGGDGSKIALGIWGDRLRTAKNSWSAGTWYHIVGVVDSANSVFEIYVNGALDNSKSPGSSIGDDSRALTIGREGDGDHPFDGRMSDIRVYGSALSGTDVQHLYDVANTNGTLTTDWRTP